ncbi:rna-directed dna polymerase from mobile element jockey- hypothetical protein [Limosa lapponica baueri]|uniref:Endonuclease/exonuclease/phosphatase domain-containing protein n=1 Tax=Limosa lapponica baueri TaxID=1758121 RepID=A0A2I0TCG7_LIMLA|nr:rna-directed dna polymerase from mobile element jockey- hypothetical protein [Limosa lapponica baueri]
MASSQGQPITNSHNWKTTMDVYKLFRKDRKGRRGAGTALYVKEKFECMEVSYGDHKSSIKCFWIKIGGIITKGNLMVGICYEPPNQGDEANETLLRLLKEVSGTQKLVLMGDFNYLDIF